MNQTQKDALKLVLSLAKTQAQNHPNMVTQEQDEAITTVQKMVDVNLEQKPKPLIDQIKGPITIVEFMDKLDLGRDLSSLRYTRYVQSGLLQFYRQGSGPHTVTNPSGTFQVGDFVSITGGRTYSIVEK